MKSRMACKSGRGRVRFSRAATLAAALLCGAALSCGMSHAPVKADAAPAAAPPASQTGGFDGQQAWGYLKTIVDFGPRPPASENIRREQQYLVKQLRSFGCSVSEDNFHAQTGVGPLAMDNIVADLPGKSRDIVLLLSHYDTVRLPGFVGADDGGSSTAALLELAHVLCGHPQALTLRLAFLDGEEEQTNFQTEQQAQTIWTQNNNTYGSRELAARLANSGDLSRVKAVILLDMVGDSDLGMTKDTTSTPWLVNLVWSTAAHLGYRQYFGSQSMAVTDDHTPFLQRGVASVDLIDFSYPPWHTTQDTLDKCSARSMAIVGHVTLATINALGQKFAPASRHK